MRRNTLAESFPFYYGWIIFAVTFLIYAFMYGLRYSIGVFFTPIQIEFDWSTSTTASVVTIFFWVYAFSAPFVGKMADKIGVRKTVFLGGLFLGGGGALLSTAQNIFHLYLYWGVIAAMGAAALYVVPTMVLSKFFLRKRGKAVGWSSIGVSLGQAMIIPLVAYSIQIYGWRGSIMGLGFIVFIVTSIVGYSFLREDPESMGLSINGESSNKDENEYVLEKTSTNIVDFENKIRSKTFMLIAISYFFAVGGIISILTFVVPHMIKIGIDPVKASGAFGIIGITSAIGSFLFGIVSDKKGRKFTILMTTGGLTLSFITASIIPPNLTILYIWTIFYGLSYGGCPEQYAAIITDYFGIRDSTSLFGILTLSGGLGGGLFPLIGGLIVDFTGTYYITLLFLALCMAIANVLILITRPTISSTYYC